MDVIVAKSSAGRTGTVQLSWCERYGRLKNTAETEENAERKRLAAKARKAAVEAANWRTWTTSQGTKIEARFCGTVSNAVRLMDRDGSKIKIPLDDLSDEDRAWIRSRKR
jgi:hypothetical protein